MENLTQPFFKLSEATVCQACKQNITLYDISKSNYVVCSFCFSYLQLNADKETIKKEQLKKPKLTPLLKIGSTATIRDTNFKVIAYLEKQEAGTKYEWREYMLTSLDKGYITIAEFNGNWSLIGGEKFIPDFKVPMSYGDTLGYHDVDYKLFNKYTPIINAMLGEVDWDIINEKVAASEFIAPPLMVVKEVINNDSRNPNYYIGEYLDANFIAETFNLDRTVLPIQIGIGAHQPSLSYDRWISSLNISIIAILLVLGLHFVLDIFKSEKELINSDFAISKNDKGDENSYKSFITPSFVINDGSSNIEFKISANLDNNWFETTIVLVNESDNRTWEVSKGIEYYHGYEGGESWSEGSREEKIMVSNIPNGKYHLNIYPSTGDHSSNSIYIRAVANSSMWRNTLLTMLAICIYPIVCYYLMRNFEKKRWENSDYSPFVSD
ncbi:DUF4178 domain-containing protein [Pedobacter sp. Leaf132]|uniref:DUF4178 domain-containing protein n=1 Tax=Pedobacter sp. Leaf132 TaxID=2876557 RepID=UPI001E575E9E|nr:DUF4178 domain-containing protein [Pedobacter sp. Leaf132]